MRTVIFFYKNNQKQVEIATVRFQLELLVAITSSLTRNVTDLTKTKHNQKSY